MRPEVISAMTDAAQRFWANPASTHSLGQRAKRIVEDVRCELADVLGCAPRDVIFTSGGTESNNWAIHDAPGLVLSRIEHPSVTRVADQLATRGTPVRWLPVHANGQVVIDRLDAILSDMPAGTCVALMAVNHETGVVQPLEQAAAIAHERGAWLHVDAIQALGKLHVTGWKWWDTVSIAAHKIQGPKGVGALAWRCGGPVPRPGLVGGSQERGLRPGTVDPVALAGFAAALNAAVSGPDRYMELRAMRNRLEHALMGFAQPNVPDDAKRLGHVASLYVPGWMGPELVAALDIEGICISSGSACAAGTAEISPVISEMLGRERARSTVRVSLGPSTTEGDIQRAIQAFSRVLRRPLK
jgi:cysteine desulfurase